MYGMPGPCLYIHTRPSDDIARFHLHPTLSAFDLPYRTLQPFNKKQRNAMLYACLLGLIPGS